MKTIQMHYLSKDLIQPPISYKNRSEWLGSIDFVHYTSFFVKKIATLSLFNNLFTNFASKSNKSIKIVDNMKKKKAKQLAPNTEKMIEALKNGSDIKEFLYNDLEYDLSYISSESGANIRTTHSRDFFRYC